MNPKTGSWFSCSGCGNPIYRSQADQRKAPQKRFYCTKKCRHVAGKEKERARQAAWHAVERGQLKRPLECSQCGSTKDIQAHHEDYSKPFDIIWLCRACHDVKSRPIWQALQQQRREAQKPCACGQRTAVVKGMCKPCYSRYRSKNLTIPCNVPGCSRKASTRGICDKHRHSKKFQHLRNPIMLRGTKPTYLC